MVKEKHYEIVKSGGKEYVYEIRRELKEIRTTGSVLPWSSGPMGVGVKHYMRSTPRAFSVLPWGSGPFGTGVPHYMSSAKKAF